MFTVFFLIVIGLVFFLGKIADSRNGIQNRLSPSAVMEIIKTDKQDYKDLTKFVQNFSPEITSYIKLGPNEYNNIKTKWTKEGFQYRIPLIDKLKLTDSTYWIEMSNTNDASKGLLTIIDTKTQKCLLLIGALSVKASVGI